MNHHTAIKKELAAALVAKAEADPEFRKALVTDTKSAVEQFLGGSLGPGFQIKTVEETEGVMYLVLPPPPAESELSDTDLAQVSGGGLNLGGFYATVQSALKKLASKAPTVEGGTTSPSPVPGGGGGDKHKSANFEPGTVTFP